MDVLTTILQEIHFMRKHTNESRELTDNYSIRETMNIVPRFDGKNMTVNTFIRACRRAREMMPSTSVITATNGKLMINNSKGVAYTTIVDCDIETFRVINFLCNRLRQIFGTYPTHEHYRSELQNILMRNNESMIEYIGRVKDLYQALIDEIRSRQGITEDKQCEIDDLTLQSNIVYNNNIV